MADNFLNRLYQNPRQPLDAASVTRVDELGNGYDDFGQMIQPKFEQPQQTWGETALGVATAPARLATALAGSLSPYGQDGWQVPPIVSEGVDALTAVGDAYTGKLAPEDINNRALGMAGFMMGGGGLAARPAGGTGMFAGRLAKTADQEALARAERLAAEGADRRAIWDQTGWYQGPDSKWRFEIDDSGAKFPAPASWSQVNAKKPITETFSHPELFAAYENAPTLRDTGGGGTGVYNPATNEIGLGGVLPRSAYNNNKHYKLAANGQNSTALHELQHWVQQNEGFASGANTTMAMATPEYERALARFNKSPASRSWSSIDNDTPESIAHGVYKRFAGETEARNVQKRMNMSADERRATPPWETQDIPDADQIVRLYSNASKEGGLLSNILGYFQGNKEPVTVRGYHGTRSEFDKFNGPSVYASENPDAASEWAMVANRDGEAPNVLPLDITALNPYYAKSLFPDQAELDRIAAADPDVVFYPPSTQHGTTFDKYPGQVFEARKPGTVRSATTGETLYSNASKEGAIPALLAYRGKQEASTLFPENATDIWASSSPQIASTYTRLGPNGEHWLDDLPASERAMFDDDDFGGQTIAPVVMDFKSPLTLDAGGSMWSEIPFEGRAVSSDDLASIARARGHDGLVINNVLDDAPGFEGDLSLPSTTYAALQRGTVRSATTGETLFSNADSKPALLASGLDMGQEARLARARDMGFDTDTTWYHGTTGDFDAFNSKMYGSTTGADGAKKAAFFASDPDIASAYVGLAPSRDYTDLVKMQEQAMAKGNSAEFDRIEGILENFQQEGVPTGGNIIPARLPNNMQTFDFYGKPWEDGAMVSAIDNARAAGLPGVVFKNIADHPYDNTRLSSVAAVFDPRNIRSVNAAFDPAKSDSANLLAANADSRPALLASGLDMGQEARLARARDMGFDTSRTMYHGTDKEFDAFSPSSDGSLGSGVYLTPSEAYAGKYGQNILETYVRGNILDETDAPASVSRGLAGPWKRNRTPATAVADWARANGYDGIRQEGFQTVVFDPKNIRSVNAAFDPAKSDSANLLAANADSRPALLGAGQEQDIPDWLLPYLR